MHVDERYCFIMEIIIYREFYNFLLVNDFSFFLNPAFTVKKKILEIYQDSFNTLLVNSSELVELFLYKWRIWASYLLVTITKFICESLFTERALGFIIPLFCFCIIWIESQKKFNHSRLQ